MSKIIPWIKAARLRTLPLALSCVVISAFLAAHEGHFRWDVFSLATLTTILLQVLANFANDYGDTQNGADNESRIGPDRMIQSGVITTDGMKKAIIITIIATLISGIALLYVSFGSALWNKEVLLLFGFGIVSIIAALKYTAGDNPYGYRALGDLSVFLFFGILGVLGNYFLYTQTLDPLVILPAVTIGTLSMAVLNLNNMRDRPADAAVGKNTIPVYIGQNNAKVYHGALLIIAFICTFIFSYYEQGEWTMYIYLIPFLILLAHLVKVIQTEESKDFDPELKKVALSTFLFSVLFGVGLII